MLKLFDGLKKNRENAGRFLEKYWKHIRFLAIIILVILIPISLIIICFVPNVNPNTVDLISILIQIEAAVIAVIITLSLVAIQLAAQTYSVRVIDTIKENKILLGVILIYIFAIIYGLFLLIYIDNEKHYAIQNLVFIEYYLSIIAFISLYPFFIATMNSLKPSDMIDGLAKKITEKKIISSLNQEKNGSDEEISIEDKINSKVEFINSFRISQIKPDIEIDVEPIQPIIDIIQSSLLNQDFVTLKHGLQVIHSKVTEIIENSINKKNQELVLNLFFTYFGKIGMQSVNIEDEDVLQEIGNMMLSATFLSIEKEQANPIILCTNYLAKICKASMKHGLEYSAGMYSINLGVIGNEVVDKKKKN